MNIFRRKTETWVYQALRVLRGTQIIPWMLARDGHEHPFFVLIGRAWYTVAMAKVDIELVRHALNAARAQGMNEVELEIGESKFSAVMEKTPASRKRPSQNESSEDSKPVTIKSIKSPSVGYFRSAKLILAAGEPVTAGDVIGEISALGLKSEVTTTSTGMVVEVLVSDGDAVDYGQVIATVETA
jgi:acetyl-CoA carboxylase biotin carboxyl carrier protein